MHSRLVSAAWGLLLCVLMLWCAGTRGALDFRDQLATSNYAPVMGRVLSSHPEAKVHMRGDRHGNVHTWTESRVGVRYEYTANGRVYQSTRLFYGDYVPYGWGNAAAWKEKHPDGSPLEVFYDPGDPARSVLLRGLTQEHWHGLLLPLLAVALGGLVLSKLDSRLLDFFVPMLGLSGAGSLWVMCVQGNLRWLALPALLSPFLSAGWVMLRGRPRNPGDAPPHMVLLMLVVAGVFLYSTFNS